MCRYFDFRLGLSLLDYIYTHTHTLYCAKVLGQSQNYISGYFRRTMEGKSQVTHQNIIELYMYCHINPVEVLEFDKQLIFCVSPQTVFQTLLDHF